MGAGRVLENPRGTGPRKGQWWWALMTTMSPRLPNGFSESVRGRHRVRSETGQEEGGRSLGCSESEESVATDEYEGEEEGDGGWAGTRAVPSQASSSRLTLQARCPFSFAPSRRAPLVRRLRTRCPSVPPRRRQGSWTSEHAQVPCDIDGGHKGPEAQSPNLACIQDSAPGVCQRRPGVWELRRLVSYPQCLL